MIVSNTDDTILGAIIHNEEKVHIALDANYPKIYGFVIDPSSQVFEIDFARHGNDLKIYLIKVYGDKENEGLGTKALVYFEKWGFKNGYKTISGELVDGKDSSSPEKLRHFYLKNQYTIGNTGNDYRYATISKSLV